MKLAHYFPYFILVVIFSCTKPPDYPIEPVIKFERFSRNTMLQGDSNNDSLVITFSFTDGDGDLGYSDSIPDIFVTDARIPYPLDPFKLPVVPVQGVGNGISGEISILVYNTCCLFDAFPACSTDPAAIAEKPIDTLTFEIYIKDRAGHESNRILTDNIYLQCDVN